MNTRIGKSPQSKLDEVKETSENEEENEIVSFPVAKASASKKEFSEQIEKVVEEEKVSSEEA